MRQVFENVAQSGFGSLSQGRTVESITFSSTRLFAGTSDGAILQAEMKPESPQFQNSPHVFCASLQTLRPPGRDRRAAASLKCVESWRVLLCIVDSTVNVRPRPRIRCLCITVSLHHCITGSLYH